jgi:hypothetical protein
MSSVSSKKPSKPISLPSEFDILKSFIPKKTADEISDRVEKMSLYFKKFKASYDLNPPKAKSIDSLPSPSKGSVAIKTTAPFLEEERESVDDGGEDSEGGNEGECAGYSSEGASENDEDLSSSTDSLDEKRLRNCDIDDVADKVYSSKSSSGGSSSEEDEDMMDVDD